MVNFWETYLKDSKGTTNCNLICKDGTSTKTHRVLLGAISTFLKSLLMDTMEAEDSFILLPDFSNIDLQQCLGHIFGLEDQTSPELNTALGIQAVQLKKVEVQNKCEFDNELFNVEEDISIKDEMIQYSSDDSNNYDNHMKPLSTEIDYNPLECSYCFKTFSAAGRLKHHITCTHEKTQVDYKKYYCKFEELYECKLCKSQFDQINKFRKHMRRSHALGAKQKCDVCGRPFYYEEELEKHRHQCEKNHSAANTKNYQCVKCGKRLSKPRMSHKCNKVVSGISDEIIANDINDHEITFVALGDTIDLNTGISPSDYVMKNTVTLNKEVDTSNFMQCEYCEHKCKNENMMKAHITLRHPEKCEQLKYIMAVNGLFQCSICAKKFKRRNKCNYHVKIFHKIGAKLECHVCKKLFFYEYDMNKHLKTHDETKAAYCDLCGKGFSGKHVLKAHVISAHTSKKEKESARSHFCSVCAKGFFNKSALNEHELLHGEERNFHCTECPKSFKQSSGLRSHIKRWHSEAGVPFLTVEQKAKMAAYMVKYRAEKKAKKLERVTC